MDISSNWELLRTREPEVVAHYSQLWSTYKALAFSERHVVVTDCDILQQNSNSFQRPQSLYRRVEAYMVLSGPYSSFLRDIYAVQSVRQIALQSPQRVALRSALPHETPSPQSYHHPFLNTLPWLNFLDLFFAEDRHHPVKGVRQLPPSSISTQDFSLELRGIHAAAASEKSLWWEHFVDSCSHESFHTQQLSYLAGKDCLVQDSVTSYGRVQKPGLSTTIKRFAMHIEVRPSKERQGENQEWLQRKFPYHAVIHGIFDTMELRDPHPITLPCVTVYEELMSINLLSDRPENLAQWRMLSGPLFIAAGFFPIFPQWHYHLSSLGQDDKAAEQSAREVLCRPIKGDLSPSGLIDGYDEDKIVESCVRFLEVILKTQDDGWTLSWSRVRWEQGLLPPIDSNIQPNLNIQLNNTEWDTKQICEALMESSSVDDARPEMFALDEKSPRAVSSSKGTSRHILLRGKVSAVAAVNVSTAWRLCLNVQPPPKPPKQRSQLSPI